MKCSSDVSQVCNLPGYAVALAASVTVHNANDVRYALLFDCSTSYCIMLYTPPQLSNPISPITFSKEFVVIATSPPRKDQYSEASNNSRSML